MHADAQYGYYGNDVVLRDMIMPSGAHKTFVDTMTSLPEGTLRQFLFYVHPRGKSISDDRTSILLHIWRPAEGDQEGLTYQLVWSSGLHYVIMSRDRGQLVQVKIYSVI